MSSWAGARRGGACSSTAARRGSRCKLRPRSICGRWPFARWPGESLSGEGTQARRHHKRESPMTTTEQNAEHHPIRLLVLDLIYPAVLGAMLVLLFTRIAPTALAALHEPPTYFALIIGI